MPEAARAWQTADVVFVTDALVGWLVGQLANAGRKKLTELVLGSEQERALRRAADAAVWATAEELSPSGGEQTGQVAMVISEVFRDPVPDAPLAGPTMLLEGLQAGIAGQLAVLDDAGLTGTGQSSADVLGVPGSVLAGRLTGHLGSVVHAAAEGRSGIAVLVGGSSTGKTRACWETLALLRDQDPPWRLWHPIDGHRPAPAGPQPPTGG